MLRPCGSASVGVVSATPAHRLPAPDPPEDQRATTLELYRLAVDEYRFQAQFNWSRTQYWLVFNSGILAAGVALMAATGRAFPVLVFALGLAACGLSMQAIRVTHGYYRNARDRVRRFEAELAIPQHLRMDTTAGLRSPRQRIRVNATAVTYLLLAALAVADAVGIVASVLR